MSESSVDLSPTDFIVGLSSLYVLLHAMQFWSLAASLSAPLAGLAKLLVALAVIVGFFEALALAGITIFLLISLFGLLFKAFQKVDNYFR